LDNIDYERFPLMTDVTCMEADIRAGDVVFVPSFFYHQVNSLEPATISINIFFGPRGDDNYVAKLLTEPRSNAFNYWLLNIIVQNRYTPSFKNLINEDLSGSIRNFLYKQFHENTTREQSKVMIDWIKEYLKELGETYLPENSSSTETRRNPRQLKIRGLSWRS
jgi:hypothetical protein